MPRKKTKGDSGGKGSKTKKQAKKTVRAEADDQEGDDKGVGSSSSVSTSRKGSDRQKHKKKSGRLAYDDGDDEDEEHNGGESGYESGWGSIHASDSEDGLGSWTSNDRRMVFADCNNLTEEAGKKQDGDIVFDVEGILSWRRHPRRGFPQFRAMWTGFPIYQNSWEPEQNFMTEGGEIETFWQRVGGRPDDCPKPAPNDPTPSVHSDTDTEEVLAREGSVGVEARRKFIRQIRKDKVDQRKYWQWSRAREKAEQQQEEAAKLALQKTKKAQVTGKTEEATRKKRKRSSRSKSSDSDAQRVTTVKKRVQTIVVSDEDSDDVLSSIRPAPSQPPVAGQSAPSESASAENTSAPSKPTQTVSTNSKPTPPNSAPAADPAQPDDASDSMDELWNEPPGASALPSSSPSPSASSSAALTPAPVQPTTEPHSARAAARPAPSAPTHQKVPEQRPRPLAQASLRRLQGLGTKTLATSPRQPQSASTVRRNSSLSSISGPSSAPATGKSSNSGSFLDLISGPTSKGDSDTRTQPQARQGPQASVPARGAYRGAHKVPNKVIMLDTPPPTTLRFNKREAANHPNPTSAPARRPSANPIAQAEGTGSLAPSTHLNPSAGAESSSVSSPATASSSTLAANSAGGSSAPALNNNGAHGPSQSSNESVTGRAASRSPLEPGQLRERRPSDRSSPSATPQTPLSPVHQARFPQSKALGGPRALREDMDYGPPGAPSRSNVHVSELNRGPRPLSATDGSPATLAASLPPQSYDPRRSAHATQLPPSMANGLAPPWMQRGRDSTSAATGVPAWVARARRQQAAAAHQNGSQAVPSQSSAGDSLPAHPVRPGSTRNGSVGTDHVASPNEVRNGASPSADREEDVNDFRGRPVSPVDPRSGKPKEPVRIGIKLANAPHDQSVVGNKSPRNNETPSSAPSPVEQQRPGFKSIGPPRSPDEPGEEGKRPQAIPIPEVLAASHDPDRDPRKRGR